MQNDPVKNAIDSLLLAKSALESQLESVNNAIKSLGGKIDGKVGTAQPVSIGGTTIAKTNDSDYNKDWALPTKFLYFLKREQRFLHFREVADLMIQVERIEGDIPAISRDLSGRLSAATRPMKVKGEIVKYNATPRHQDTFWGIPKWLDENGAVKPGHEINKEYLMSQLISAKIDFEI